MSNLLDDAFLMEMVYREYPRQDIYPAADDDAHECENHWRTIYCNGSRDIIRCEECGREKEISCDFDEDYA